MRQRSLWKGGLTSGLILFLVVFAGCRDINETIKNDTGVNTTMFAINLHINGAGAAFPAVSSWHEDRVPTITPRPELGPGWFQLKWSIPLGMGEEVHIGCSFEKGQEVQRGCTEWWFGSQTLAQDETVCELSMEVDLVPSMRFALQVRNLSTTDIVDVSALQWAVSPERIDLANLVWGDPVLEALNWQDISDGPFSLAPEEESVFDIDESQLPRNQWALVRSMSGVSEADTRQLVTQRSTNDLLPIPSLTNYGVLLLLISVLLSGAWVAHRKRQASVQE